MNPLVQTQTASEVIDKELNVETEDKKLSVITSLVQYMEKLWADAKEAKEDIEDEMLELQRQRRGEYDPQKLSEILSAEQPPIFMNITDTKCRNAIAWIKDILMTGDRIFSVAPTPVPELPIEVTQKIQQQVLNNFIQTVVQEAMATGQQMDEQTLRSIIVSSIDEIKDKVKTEIEVMSEKLADDVADKVDDDWDEGGFYKALEECIDDVISLKAGIIKGIVFRKVRVQRTQLNDRGILEKVIEERIVPQYDRRSPFCIYPSPHSTDVDNGYLFDVITIKPSQLFNLIGVEGYSEKEIRDVLREFNEGKLTNDWLGLSESAKEGMMYAYNLHSLDQYADENIFGLELWDEVRGDLLKEWGVEVEDDDNEYPCCIRKIGSHIISATLNPDLMGRKPYAKASFQIINDSFWGSSLTELIKDCQQVCNACARSILANVGFGALPQVELNVDRLEPNASRKIYPAKIWAVTEEQMAAGSRAVNFFQPQMVTDKLMNVYLTFSRIADEHSGVPAYAHGDASVGGAGSTSSGLHQLVQMASRGIKAVVRNIDLHIIVPCLQRHYDYLLDNQEVYGLVGDYKISARGTQMLIAKEQLAQRKLEFLNNTANPVDAQILGVENRKKMLFEIAKSMGIELSNAIQPMSMPQQAPAPSPQNLDQAGNPMVGQDTRQFNQGGIG